MSIFTSAEKAYLQSQRLGRLATVGPDDQPHVVPVGFHYNYEAKTVECYCTGYRGRQGG
jgi:nitroimidazol reductase NimA-like FMN-containing flavoprotein (pyridoxamine 5'-phosphate oxidase superfamily)